MSTCKIETEKIKSKERILRIKNKATERARRIMRQRKKRGKKREFSLGKNQHRFQILRFNAVAIWKHDHNTDICAICRNYLHESCIECEASGFAGIIDDKQHEDCTIAWGVCNHVYHMHCISRFLRNHNICPLDAQEWELEKIGK